MVAAADHRFSSGETHNTTIISLPVNNHQTTIIVSSGQLIAEPRADRAKMTEKSAAALESSR